MESDTGESKTDSPSATTPLEIKRFLSEISPHLSVWRHAEVRWSAMRRDEEWFNLSTRILFSARSLASLKPEVYLDLPDVRAGRFAVLGGEAIEAIRSSGSGRLRAGPVDLRLATPTQRTSSLLFTEYSWISEAAEPGSSTFGIRYIDLPGYGFSFNLLGTGGMLGGLVDHREWSALERSMLNGTPPVVGFRDLLNNFLYRVGELSLAHPAALTVYAPFYATLEQPEVSPGDQVGIVIRGPSTSVPADFELVVIRRTAGSFERSTVRMGEKDLFGPEPPDPNDRLQLAHTVEIRDADWCGVFLLFRRLHVAELAIPLPNPYSGNVRYRVAQLLDQWGVRMAELLAGDRQLLGQKDRFEVALGALLSLCGFQVLLTDTSYFKTNSDGFSDVIAFAPGARSLLVCEATVDNLLVSDKLVRLRKRADRVSDLLESDGFEVVAAVVTTSPQVMEEEWETARRLKLAILSPVDLEELYRMAGRNELPSACLAVIRSRVRQPPA